MVVLLDIGKENILIEIEQFFFLKISSSSKTSTSYTSGTDNGDAQKRFSNAKGISSDQFFNKDSNVKSKIFYTKKK